MTFKNTTIADPSLISGSSDLFRTAYGGFYTAEDSDLGSSYLFSDAITTSPVAADLGEILFDIGNQTTADYTNLVPSFSFPVRIASNSENIESDQEWRSYILGGEYGQKTYTEKISDTIHEYLNIPYGMPYSKKEVLYLENQGISEVVEISYDYSQHLADYEAGVNNFETELYIPNYYILSDFYRHKDELLEDTSKIYPSELLSFITFEEQYETPEILFSFNGDKIPYVVPFSEISSFTEIRKMNTDLVNEYLSSPSFSAPIGSSTVDWAKSKQKTILIDNEAIINLNVMQDYHDCLPYKMKISFPTKTTGDFTKNFVENEYDSKILYSLNEAFTAQQNIVAVDKTYARSSEYQEGDSEGTISTVYEAETLGYREINYIEFLTHCRDQYKNTNSDIMFIGENNIRRLSTLDENGIYRHINTKNSLSTLQYAIDFLNDPTKIGVNDSSDLFSQKSNYEETIAYRVEKVAGSGTGDGLTQNAIQNYWFLNSEDLSEFKFFDSQVKANSDYTYNIYTYVLTAGIKYEYSNLLLTRDLGEIPSTNFLYGLEFYDPNGEEGNNTEDRLFDDSGGTYEISYPFATMPITVQNFDDSGGGTYGTDAHIYSNYKYLADFKITYEPFLKVIEVPIFSKTLRIVDNPPNRLNINPHQILNDEQKIGFDLYYDTFAQASFPSSISESDAEYTEHYLNGKDLLSTSTITEKTVSKQRTIEVYRLSTMPTSLEDFDGNLYKTISLKPKNEKFYRNTFETCISQIKTNQKYYYLFRVLNEQGTPGHISEIYETELINDGGYKFALFNTILESDLGELPEPESSKQVKKIFQLRPKIDQIEMDTTNSDFNESAESQISSITIGNAEDLIWDKTFKVRLTSKKTGKKVDLNITYKIGGE